MIVIISFSHANIGSPLLKKNFVLNKSKFQNYYKPVMPDNTMPLGGSQFTYGFRIGQYVSNISFDGHTGIIPMDTLYETYNKNGLAFGAIINYSFNNRLSLQTEINFEQKGTKYNGDFYFFLYGITYENSLQSTIDLNFVTIPLLLKASFGRQAKFYLSAGPYLGILSKARQKSVFDIQIDVLGLIEDSTIVYDDLQNDRYRNDFGVVFNGGLQIPIIKGVHGNAGFLFIEFRYNYGLRDIFEDIEVKENTLSGPVIHKFVENIKIRSYGLNAGLKFSF
jgi:hypothetical protein